MTKRIVDLNDIKPIIQEVLDLLEQHNLSLIESKLILMTTIDYLNRFETTAVIDVKNRRKND